MNEAVVVCIISLIGTIIGSLGGIVAAGKLTTFRLQKLEEKVQAHNNLIERMYKVEGSVKVLETEIEELKKGA